jgi:hypothetical protein
LWARNVVAYQEGGRYERLRDRRRALVLALTAGVSGPSAEGKVAVTREVNKFITPGTYEYTVHVSATKAHAHRGTVVVK